MVDSNIKKSHVKFLTEYINKLEIIFKEKLDYNINTSIFSYSYFEKLKHLVNVLPGLMTKINTKITQYKNEINIQNNKIKGMIGLINNKYRHNTLTKTNENIDCLYRSIKKITNNNIRLSCQSFKEDEISASNNLDEKPIDNAKKIDTVIIDEKIDTNDKNK